MLKKIISLAIASLLIFSTVQAQDVSISQRQYNVNYVRIENNQPLISPGAITYAVNTFANIYTDAKRTKRAREEAAAKIDILKTNYSNYESYPESIMDGWHKVMATDNFNFCREAKALVENNRIIEFAIDNCFKLNFSAVGQIKKGKNVITLQNFNGEELEVADVYFIFDMDEPVITTPPVEPGFISFWSSKGSYVDKVILINDIRYNGVKQKIKKAPNCGDPYTQTITLKPGSYTFRALKSGNDLDGSFEILAGQCLIYRLD